MTDPALALEGVTAIRGGRLLLDRISLAVGRGERVAVAAPSGAGKSVLAGIAGGLLRADSGLVRLEGVPAAVPWPPAVRRKLAMVLQGGSLFEELDVETNLRLAAGAGAKAIWDALAARVDRLLIDFGLEQHAHEQVRTVSVGARRRLEIARAFMGQPAIVIADEPFQGAAADIAPLIDVFDRGLKRRDMALLLFTQDQTLAERIGARIYRLNEGQLI